LVWCLSKLFIFFALWSVLNSPFFFQDPAAACFLFSARRRRGVACAFGCLGDLRGGFWGGLTTSWSVPEQSYVSPQAPVPDLPYTNLKFFPLPPSSLPSIPFTPPTCRGPNFLFLNLHTESKHHIRFTTFFHQGVSSTFTLPPFVSVSHIPCVSTDDGWMGGGGGFGVVFVFGLIHL